MQNFSAQSGLGVTVTSSGGNGPDKIIAALTAGTPPDLVDGFHFNMSSLFRQGATLDIDAELKGNADWKKLRPGLYQEIAGGFTWKGKLFAVPLYSSFFSMYYQPEHLEARRPDRAAAQDVDVGAVHGLRQAGRPPAGRLGLRGPVVLLAHRDDGAQQRPPHHQPGRHQVLLQLPGGDRGHRVPDGPGAAGPDAGHDGSANGESEEAVPRAGRLPVRRRRPRARLPQGRDQFGTCYFPSAKNTAKKNVTHGEAYGFAVFKNKDARSSRPPCRRRVWGTRPDLGFTSPRPAGRPRPTSTPGVPEFQAEFKNDADVWPFYELMPDFIPMPNFPGFGDVRTMGDMTIQDIWLQKRRPRGPERVHPAGPAAAGRGAEVTRPRGASTAPSPSRERAPQGAAESVRTWGCAAGAAATRPRRRGPRCPVQGSPRGSSLARGRRPRCGSASP